MQNLIQVHDKNLLLPLELDQDQAKNKLELTPLPMQYLGSKTRISSWIISSIKKYLPEDNKLYDLMAGTGSVAYEALKNGYTVAANDVQPYSYAILKSLLSTSRNGIPVLLKILDDNKTYLRLLANGRHDYLKYLELEDLFFHQVDSNELNWTEYSEFCKAVPIVNTISDIEIVKKKGEWNLFTNYYANTYFGIRQCLEIDLLREISDSLPDSLKTHLIASTISSMTFNVSSTTHLAQFLKPSNNKNALNLIKRRSKSMIKSVITRLTNLMSDDNYSEEFNIFNSDFKDALDLVNGTNWVVYADPPYFKEHYSRYYHVLDTFYLYDYPELTYNPRIGQITTGRYRENRIVSQFGKKAEAKLAFKMLLEQCRKKRMDVVISYANTSLVSKEDILTIGENNGFKCSLLEKNLLHSGQGQPRNRTVTEYLFIFSNQYAQ